MGSKLTTVRGHKEAATLAQDPAPAPEESRLHEQTESANNTNNTTATSPLPAFDSACKPTSIHDPTDAMDPDEQLPRRSTESDADSILLGFSQLPGDVSSYERGPQAQQSWHRQSSEQPPPPSEQSPQPCPLPSLTLPTRLADCLVCCSPCDGPGKNPAKEVHPCRKCDNAYCVPCIKNMFLRACEDFSRMPPRCCDRIQLHHVRPYLSANELDLFKDKYEEWDTPNPFYCPVPRCSTFISDRLLPRQKADGKGKQRIDSAIGTPTRPTISCPGCRVEICTHCRTLAHADGICSPFDFGVDEHTADLLQIWGYRKCPKCGQGVKRMFGCNHMECRCGAHFCWGCMQGMDTCIGNCEESDEESDVSDYEPDKEDESDFQAQDAPTPQLLLESGLADMFPHQSQDEESTQPTTAMDREVLPSPPDQAPEDSKIESETRRVRNLDGGQMGYWENADLDFGDEPQDEWRDRAWNCYHFFETAKVTFKEAFDEASVSHMECSKCWATIHPEVEMPDSIRFAKTKMTTALASGSTRVELSGIRRAFHTRRLATLRSFASLESFEAFHGTDTPFPEPISESYSSFTSHRTSLSIDPRKNKDTACVEDLYGNLVATAGVRKDQGMLDWHPVDEVESRLSFETESTPFSFAFECCHCGLLVCQSCKDVERERQDPTPWDEDSGHLAAQETSQGAADETTGDEQTSGPDGDRTADGHEVSSPDEMTASSDGIVVPSEELHEVEDGVRRALLELS